MFLALIAMAVMITVSVSDYYSSKKINNTDFITEDSHYVSVSATAHFSVRTKSLDFMGIVRDLRKFVSMKYQH